MRGATKCAVRVKAVFSSLRARLGRVTPPATGDPVTQMLLGILSRDVPESKAREALDRIRSAVVDYNELRVIPPIELAEMLGDYPDVRLKSEDISRALNRIFAMRHAVSLDHLADMSPKEVIAELNRIDGLEAYTRARIRLLGLRQHAIPLDEAMWAYARHEGMVDPRCSLEEAQAFLERQISQEEALEFVSLLKRQAWADFGAAVRRREVARILSVPPDRTTRNMLAAIAAAASGTLPPDDTAEEPSPPEPRPARSSGKTKSVKVTSSSAEAAGTTASKAPALRAAASSGSKKRKPSTKSA
jgi:hypothetical protein